jgi:hypothetical protein
MLSDPETVISMKYFALAAPAPPERYLTAPPQAHSSLSYFFRLMRACRVTRGVVHLAAALPFRSSRRAKCGANPVRVMVAVFAMLMSFGALAHVDDPSTTVARPVALRKQAVAYEHESAKDPARAIALYCEAARLGDGGAQFNLGWMYANGRGVARDDALAAYFFRAAAQVMNTRDAGVSRRRTGRSNAAMHARKALGRSALCGVCRYLGWAEEGGRSGQEVV